MISNQNHKEQKQLQKISLQYSCSVTIVNITKKYMSKKINELNNLTGTFDDSESQVQNKYIVKPVVE